MKINSCHFYYTNTILIKNLLYFAIFFIASFNYDLAYSKSCTHYLIPRYQINFDENDGSNEFNILNDEINKVLNEGSVRKLVTLFNKFKSGFHERYDSYLEDLTRTHPNLALNNLMLRTALQPFYQNEMAVITQFKKEITKFSLKKRKHYLQSLSPKKLIQNQELLNALFGIDESEFLSQNLASLSWSTLITIVENMDFESEELNVDQYPDLELEDKRLRLLISILHPELNP